MNYHSHSSQSHTDQCIRTNSGRSRMCTCSITTHRQVRSGRSTVDWSSNAAFNINATVHIFINFTITDPCPPGGSSSLGWLFTVTVGAGRMRTRTLLLSGRLHRSCRSSFRLHTIAVRVELPFFRPLWRGRRRRLAGSLPREAVFLWGGVRVVGPHGGPRCRPRPCSSRPRSSYVSVLRRLFPETGSQFSSV